jgi:type IV pilus assembly protein PilX
MTIPAVRPFRPNRSASLATRQRGVALIVAMVLLIVITLVGLAAIRGTIMQQKMAANLYDRQVAFQNAEAALRAAAAMIPSNPALIARNCQSPSVTCLADPFTDSGLPSGAIHSVEVGAASGQYTAGTNAVGQPQFVVESMGNWTDPDTSTGFNKTANAHNYGAQGKSTTALFYRITARSSDPSATKGRAMVVLQAMVKRS